MQPAAQAPIRDRLAAWQSAAAGPDPQVLAVKALVRPGCLSGNTAGCLLCRLDGRDRDSLPRVASAATAIGQASRARAADGLTPGQRHAMRGGQGEPDSGRLARIADVAAVTG
jgi:hypothetical protein